MKEDMNELLDEQNDIQNALSKEIGDPTPDEVLLLILKCIF